MSGRLTDLERAERQLREDAFQEAVTDLAGILGWDWMHVRPGMRANGRWWTATTGPLAKWPDLTLVRTRDRRLIFAELKRELEQPKPEQQAVLEILSELSVLTTARIEVHVWRPSDLRDPIAESTIGRILR